MASLNYLSKKCILMEEIRKNQLKLLELKKEHQILIKNDEIESGNELFMLNKVEIHSRNDRLLQDLKDQYNKLDRVLNVDNDRLGSIKEKYLRSIKEAAEKETKETIKVKKDTDLCQSLNPNVTLKVDDTLLAPVITPRLHDNRGRMRSPSPTNVEIFNTEENEREYFVNENNIYDTSDGGLLSINLAEEVSNESDQEGIHPPLITPRLLDHRERMVSPRPQSNVVLESKSEEVFINDDKNIKEESLELEDFLGIFEAINTKLDMRSGDYREEYLNGAKIIDQIKPESSQSIRRLLEQDVSYDEWKVSLKELISFVVKYLPIMCANINFDISELLNTEVSTLMSVRSSINKDTFNNLSDMIRNKLCKNKNQTLLWNPLKGHLNKLILDGFLSSNEISSIFSPLLFPISSSDNKGKIIEMISSWLSYADEKQKSQLTMSSTMGETSLLSDDDTNTYSSATHSSITKKPEMKKIERSYSDLKRSLNMANVTSSKIESIDDDPNEDINDIFAKPKTKGRTGTTVEMNLSKERLTKSILNIDDDISADFDIIQTKNEKKNNYDDDFDFK